MSTLSTIRAVLALLVLAGSAVAVPAPRRLPDGGWLVPHVVVHRDGREFVAQRRPIAGFGSVTFLSPDGRWQAVRASEVNLEASRRAWDRSDAWAVLDRSASIGQAMPVLTAVSPTGAPVRLPPAEKWTVIEFYHRYCLPCLRDLRQAHEWMAAGPALDVEIVAACVDCSAAHLADIVEDSRFRAVAGWTNARLAEIPKWLSDAMANRLSHAVMVGADGTIRHERVAGGPAMIEELCDMDDCPLRENP